MVQPAQYQCQRHGSELFFFHCILLPQIAIQGAVSTDDLGDTRTWRNQVGSLILGISGTSRSGQVCHLFVQLSLSWFYWFIVWSRCLLFGNVSNSFWKVCSCSSELVTSLILTVVTCNIIRHSKLKVENWRLQKNGVNSKHRLSIPFCQNSPRSQNLCRRWLLVGWSLVGFSLWEPFQERHWYFIWYCHIACSTTPYLNDASWVPLLIMKGQGVLTLVDTLMVELCRIYVRSCLIQWP